MQRIRVFIYVLLLGIASTQLFAQGKVYTDGNERFIGSKVIEGDTVLHVNITEITILPAYRFKSKRHYRRYSRLTRYVKKVYPYSVIIRQKIAEIEKELKNITNDKEKRIFIRKKEKELRKEFEGELVSLTILQGRILMKLVDRETGKTTYDQIKNYKGNVHAFFWQSIAVMFGSNLKAEYQEDGDDKMIEDIIIRIENGQL